MQQKAKSVKCTVICKDTVTNISYFPFRKIDFMCCSTFSLVQRVVSYNIYVVYYEPIYDAW